MLVTFNTSFLYSGGNLLVGIYQTVDGASYSSCSWYGQTASGASVQGHASALNSITASQQNFIPKTTFYFTGGGVTCPSPTGLAVSAITATSATVSWTPGGTETNWVLEYSTNSDFSSSASVNVSGTPSTNLSGLSSNITYYIRVKAVCSNSDESGWRTNNFKTSIAIPWCETFETSSIPADWSQYSGLLSDVQGGAALTTGSSWAFGNTNALGTYHAKLNIYGTSCKYWLVTPEINLSGNADLSFDLALTDYYYADPIEDNTSQADDRFVVLIQANGAWSILREWNNSGSAYVYNNISYTGQNESIDLSAYTGQTVKIAFYGESTASGGDNDLHIDNVCLSSSCNPAGIEYQSSYQTVTVTYGEVSYGGASNHYMNTHLVNPHDRPVSYSISGDGTVATINSSTGEVTINRPGIVTVTVSSNEGDGYCAGNASYTLTIECPTVGNPTPHPESRCGVGSVTLTATPGANGNTCRWYSAASGGTLLETGTSYETPSISANTTYYVTSYNTSTGCESSSRVAVTATVNVDNLSYTGSTSYALGATVNITLTGCTSYTWTSNHGGSGNSATVSETAMPGLIFHVTGSSNGCDFHLDIPITITETSGGAASTCETTIIYCSDVAGNDTYNGSTTQPVKTVAKALELAGSPTDPNNPVIIRLASGTYNINAPINLKSNVIIDGQWTANVSTGVWTKGTATTTIHRLNSNVQTDHNAPRLVAIEGSSVSGFKLQDVTVSTANATQMTVSGNTSTYINMPQTGTATYEVTSGIKIYDNNGSGSDYSTNCNGYVVLKPRNGGKIQVSGTAIVEGGYDYIEVYSCDASGTNTETHRSGSMGSGTAAQTFTVGPFTSTDPSGCLKLRFYSDGSNQFAGLDLTITEVNQIKKYGVSTYAVHLNGCSNYEFVRCQIRPGNACAGRAGDNGATGTAGGGGAGGNGGNGGSGGSSASAGSQGSQGTTVNGVSGGSGGTGGSGRTGTDCPDITAYSGSSGSSGNTGATGTAGAAGTISNATNYSAYFTPTQAGAGGRGSNGSGGGGGGGGGGVGARCGGTWYSASGGKGGSGGAGGTGGFGGTGGYGGGSSFGVYHYGSTSLGTFTDCNIVSGTRGNGGNGGSGGTGGNGLSGSSGNSGSSVTYSALGWHVIDHTSYGGSGGSGGTGGKGGTGGAGGSGANGVSYKIAVVGTSGLTNSYTTGYSTTLSNYVAFIDYGESSKVGCTNSQIFVTKTNSGAYLGSGAHYVNDLTDESTTSPSGNNAAIYYENTGLNYTALSSSTQNNPYIFITQSRALGAVTGANGICKGTLDPVKFTYGGTIKEDDYFLWRVLSSDGNHQYAYLAIHADADDDAEGTSFEINPSLLSVGTYLIKLEIINECCGISIPIWKKITVSQLEATIEFGD
ncbi:MAG: choice-of-anchor J domain-containing protein [Bacteroidales bacterium]|nr:choice-of-anchor J domain-containing protein [Bacteroidales bacterium]